MIEIDEQDAKATLVELIERVGGGETLSITRSGKPIARLIPYRRTGERTLGQDAGLYQVPEDLDAPLPTSLFPS